MYNETRMIEDPQYSVDREMQIVDMERNEKECDEYYSDCGIYGTHSSWDCAKRLEVLNKIKKL